VEKKNITKEIMSERKLQDYLYESL